MESGIPQECADAEEKAEAARTRLLVGLGNPGAEYACTRHNAGFLVADALMAGTFRKCLWQPLRGELWSGTVGEGTVHVLKPMTFMNSSGEAVGETVRRLGISPRELLVVCDDLDMELGRLRLRTKGSAGGHRGVASIAEALGTTEFPRLRMGIGRPQSQETSVIDYVLGAWASDEEPAVEKAVAAAVEIAMRCMTVRVEGVTWRLPGALSDNGNATNQGETEVEKV